MAILGDDVPLRRAAALASLPIDAATAAADALAGVEIVLAREPLRFVHPLVQHAIEQDIPLFERASRHLEAARLMYADGENVERVAAHLLLGHAGADEWAVDQLRAAAASSDPRRRAELGLQLGRALDALGQHEEAAGAYDAALQELSGGDLSPRPSC